MKELSLFKTAILTWTYEQLNAEFPEYFNSKNYINENGERINNLPNVYWAGTMRSRNENATECYLDLVSDDAFSFGTDGKFFQDKQDGQWYYELTETHEVVVNFAISSMKSKELNLTALQAQNLSYNALTFLRMQLKSGSASDYFCYDNKFLTPILVCSQNSNVTAITDISVFEDTRNRHTNQFSCKFSFEQVSRRKMDLAQNIHNEVIYDTENGKVVSIEFNTKEDKE